MTISAKVIIIIFSLIGLAYIVVLEVLNAFNRSLPVPEVLRSYYNESKYKIFLEYADKKVKLNIISEITFFLGILIVVIANPFKYFESLIGDRELAVSIICAIIVMTLYITHFIVITSYDYIKIENKYSHVSKNKWILAKELGILAVLYIPFSVGVCCVSGIIVCNLQGISLKMISVLEHPWGVIKVVLISYFIYKIFSDIVEKNAMKKQYDLKPLEVEDLNLLIQKLIKGTKRKLKGVYVYNESKYSITKQAFLAKRLWTYELYLSDNLINSEDRAEVIATCYHEIGHFKAKRRIGELIYDNQLLLWLIVFTVIMSNYNITSAFVEWIRLSFELYYNNYFLIIAVVWMFLKPIIFCVNVIGNYISRKMEYAADLEAVKAGYGEDMIRSFYKVHEEELEMLNPHPVVELLEYSHPGIYSRIKNVTSN